MEHQINLSERALWDDESLLDPLVYYITSWLSLLYNFLAFRKLSLNAQQRRLDKETIHYIIQAIQMRMGLSTNLTPAKICPFMWLYIYNEEGKEDSNNSLHAIFWFVKKWFKTSGLRKNLLWNSVIRLIFGVLNYNKCRYLTFEFLFLELLLLFVAWE